jgi:hypothetical protein
MLDASTAIAPHEELFALGRSVVLVISDVWLLQVEGYTCSQANEGGAWSSPRLIADNSACAGRRSRPMPEAWPRIRAPLSELNRPATGGCLPSAAGG